MEISTVIEADLGSAYRIGHEDRRQTDVRSRAGSHRRFPCPDDNCHLSTAYQIRQIWGQVGVQRTDTLFGNPLKYQKPALADAYTGNCV